MIVVGDGFRSSNETFRILRGRKVICEEREGSAASRLTAEIEESGGDEARLNAVRVLRRDMATTGLACGSCDDRQTR